MEYYESYNELLKSFHRDLDDMVEWIRLDVESSDCPVYLNQVTPALDDWETPDEDEFEVPDWIKVLYDEAVKANINFNLTKTPVTEAYVIQLDEKGSPVINDEDLEYYTTNPMSRILFSLSAFDWGRRIDDMPACLSDPYTYNRALAVGYLQNCVDWFWMKKYEEHLKEGDNERKDR